MEDIHLDVYLDRSELHEPGNPVLIFEEGVASEGAKTRYIKIKNALEDNHLTSIIDQLISGKTFTSSVLSDEQTLLFMRLVDSITSEVGRALVAITIMQLTIKSIAPEQSIMLHKGSSNVSSFSWREGISMRALDKYYITPVLRKYELVRLNADGFMMTRSLAENYPYSKLYKAKLKGARQEWLEVVSQLEEGKLNPDEALKYLLSLLINRAENFNNLADSVIAYAEKANLRSLDKVFEIINEHVKNSSYKARLFEISMHSYFQALAEMHSLDGYSLKPLSQMRSANKKHGNVGDIELLDGQRIAVSWDAKYGKEYLRDEIEELYEKIAFQTQAIQDLGFVVNDQIMIDEEISARITEISEITGNKIEILTFSEWINRYARGVDTEALAQIWMRIYVESLGQRRRDIAPIDEPCNAWLESLRDIFEDTMDL